MRVPPVFRDRQRNDIGEHKQRDPRRREQQARVVVSGQALPERLAERDARVGEADDTEDRRQRRPSAGPHARVDDGRGHRDADEDADVKDVVAGGRSRARAGRSRRPGRAGRGGDRREEDEALSAAHRDRAAMCRCSHRQLPMPTQTVLAQ